MAVQAEGGTAVLARLSPRDREVLERISRGMTNAQTAADLHITTHAVKYHLASIYRKLGVANRTEAAVRFWEHTSGAHDPRPGVAA